MDRTARAPTLDALHSHTKSAFRAPAFSTVSKRDAVQSVSRQSARLVGHIAEDAPAQVDSWTHLDIASTWSACASISTLLRMCGRKNSSLKLLFFLGIVFFFEIEDRRLDLLCILRAQIKCTSQVDHRL